MPNKPKPKKTIETLFREGKYSEVIPLLAKKVKHEPSDARRRMLADCYLNTGAPQDAVAVLLSIENMTDLDRQRLSESLGLPGVDNPDQDSLAFMDAYFYQALEKKQNKPGEAIKDLHKAVGLWLDFYNQGKHVPHRSETSRRISQACRAWVDLKRSPIDRSMNGKLHFILYALAAGTPETEGLSILPVEALAHLKTARQEWEDPVVYKSAIRYFIRRKNWREAVDHSLKMLEKLTPGERLEPFQVTFPELTQTDRRVIYDLLADSVFRRDPHAFKQALHPALHTYTPALLSAEDPDLLQDLIALCDSLLKQQPKDYYTHRCRVDALALLDLKSPKTEKALREALQAWPEAPYFLSKLALVYEAQGRIHEALQSIARAVEIDPHPVNQDIIHRLKRLDDLLSVDPGSRLGGLKDTERNLLVLFYRVGHFDNLEHLARISHLDIGDVRLALAALTALNLACPVDNQEEDSISDEALFSIGRDQYLIDIKTLSSLAGLPLPSILALTPSDTTAENITKEAINDNEWNCYQALQSLFPEDSYFIAPNIALAALFNDQSARERFSQGDLKFFFSSSVDFCIIDKKSRKPLLVFEIDSTYHDHPDQVIKDRQKNNIILKGNLPLVRIRVDKGIQKEVLRERLRITLKELGGIFNLNSG
ncbi:MAG: tetratricopeptide repeat protein [Omnitrophica WOR_2 bacterium]